MKEPKKAPNKTFEKARRGEVSVRTVGQLIKVLEKFPKNLGIEQGMGFGCKPVIAKHFGDEHLSLEFDEVDE